MTQKVTTSVVFRLNKKNTQNECPIAIRITKDRETRLLHVGYSVTESYWDKKNNTIKHTHPKYSEIRQKIQGLMADLSDKIQELNLAKNYFTVDDLVSDRKISKTSASKTVFEFFDELCLRMKKSGNISTLNTYKAAFAWLKEFLDEKDITFEKLNYKLLNDLLVVKEDQFSFLENL